MRFNHLNVPIHWETFYTKYPEGYTILEALISWVGQVDSMVDNVNDWNVYLDNFVKEFDKDLQKKVSDTLTEWQDSGLLDLIIDQALQTQIDYAITDTENLQLTVDKYADLGTKLTLRKKTFELTAPLLLPSNIEIDFNNSTIKRKTGAGVFDLIKNTNSTSGNTNIKLSNLTIDGNKAADSLAADIDGHRFSGLKLTKVTDSILNNVTVKNTVNGEEQQTTPAAGIFFVDCKDIQANGLHGFYNDRTAIFLLRSKVKINGSVTAFNAGSGISSNAADGSEYYNIETHDNGYSNLSVNGVNSIVDNVRSYNSLYSGVNIGHNGYPADGCQINNVISYNNTFEGLTIGGSADVQVNNLEVYGNKRHNIQVFDGSTRSRMSNVHSHDSAGGYGIFYRSGEGHKLNNARIFKNWVSGIHADTGTQGTIGDNVSCSNNGQGISANNGGIVLNNCFGWVIGSVKCTDNQTTKTQETGIWIASGGDHVIDKPLLKGNRVNLIRLTTSPANVNIYHQASGLQTMSNLNAWTTTGTYYRDTEGYVKGRCVTSGGTADTGCTLLPIGYRPIQDIIVVGFDTTNNQISKVKITAGGEIKPQTSIANQEIHFQYQTVQSALLLAAYMG